MLDERPPTDDELEELMTGALNQLANAVCEYKDAKRDLASNQPSKELAVKRFNVAKDSLRNSLTTYHILRDEIERRGTPGQTAHSFT